jgi:hypothetical protein
MKMPSRCVGNTECSRAGDADVVWKVRVLIDDINEKTEAVTKRKEEVWSQLISASAASW